MSNELKETLEWLGLEVVHNADGSTSITEASLRRAMQKKAQQEQVQAVADAVAPKTIEAAREMAKAYLRGQAGPQPLAPAGKSVPANQPPAVESVKRS